MMAQPTAMHVVRIKSSHTDKQGREREYESRLLRRTWRDGGTVRNETLANLSKMPDRIVDAVEAALKGQALVPAGEAAVSIARSRPHGHVAAVHAMARTLGLPALLGPPGRQRDLALALIISRVVAPGSKLSTLAWWGDVTLGADLGIGDATTDEAYAAIDWLQGRQDAIERRLARRHLAPAANPSRMALFDLSSSWLEGRCCPLGALGYSRDGKKGKLQIEYGLLTDPQGRPVAVRVFEGSTADPAAFTEILDVVHGEFGLRKMIMVGDRGMITSARIGAIRELDARYGWITALRAPAIRKLMAEDGPLQLSLFDEQDLAEISSPEFPGERLVACRNPALAEERARKREALLAATEKLLAPIAAQGGARPARRRRRNRHQSRRGPEQAQDGQAPPDHHHRYQPHLRTEAGADRRRGPARRDLRYPLPRPRSRPRCPPPWSLPTRTSNTSSATSATSNPTTWTCARSSTASSAASRATC